MEAPCFVSDIYVPQMLYALTVRSPVAKGRLVSIECPELPEGCTLIKAGDIPGENSLWGSDLPILASGELSYIGEPVALLLGLKKDRLEKYALSCKVIAEEGRPVFSIGEATAIADTEPGLIAARRDIRVGEPEEAFASAASIVKGDYETGIQEHWYSEPCGAIAWLEGQGIRDEQEEEGQENGGASQEQAEGKGQKGQKLVIRTATQCPLHIRHSVARVLGSGHAAPAIQVQPTAAGLHLDGKFWYPSLVSCHAALGAWVTGKPVRLILNKKEDFFFSPKRFGARISVSSAFDEQGELIGTDVEASINLGAYGVSAAGAGDPSGAAEMLDQVCLGSLGIYASKNIRFRGMALRTNIPPQGPFAGLGLAQGSFALERHASLIADKRRQDPSEWRKARFLKTNSLPLGLPVKEAIPGERLLDSAMNMSDYRRKWASYELLRRKRHEQLSQDDSQQTTRVEIGESLRGIGIAIGYQGNKLLHPGPDGGGYGVELILEKDGSLEIKAEMAGSDQAAVWTGIALEILGVEAGNVRISCNDKTFQESGIPESGPAIMSHKATDLTRLVEEACLAIRGQRFRDPLPISVVKTGGPQEDPEWNKHFSLPGGAAPDCSGFLQPGSAAAVVEVEIDPVEYVPKIRGVWLAVDGGRVFRKDKASRSLRLSAVQALGWAYREQIGYAEGRIPVDAFRNFDIQGASEAPPVGISFIENSSDEPKGIGDLPFNCIPAAYLEAVSQAMDWHFRSIPLKARDLWHAAMTKAKKGEEG